MSLRLPAHVAPAQRRCLGVGCERTFRSLGPGLRFCPRCVTRKAGTYVSPLEQKQAKDSRK